jgi:hypothetical protein
LYLHTQLSTLEIDTMGQNRQQRSFRETLLGNVPVWKLMASNAIDRACCFSYAVADFDDEDYDQGNSIVLSPSLVSCSFSEHTATPELIAKGKKDKYLFLDASQNAAIKPEYRRKTSGQSWCSGNTATTASVQSSIPSVMTGSTIGWSEFDEEYAVSATQRRIPVSLVSCKTFKPKRSNHVRRWSGVDNDITEACALSADVYHDVMVIRKVQSESLAELPYLSRTEGYAC